LDSPPLAAAFALGLFVASTQLPDNDNTALGTALPTVNVTFQ